jgi:Mg-chelatase subunit ChlD
LFDVFVGGGTPLCKHIREVIEQIRLMEPQLRANAQKAVLVIATDGESSDGDIAEAMKPLEKLPVWVVIRLCTDDSNVVNYWNNIDRDLELEIDILDDISGEAREIHSANSWITYGEPLHRLREWGVSLKELDLIDESKLNTEQMKVVCAML